ncbi:MAG: 2OG-Fe(II) oxygenase [Sphingomicrobium sp.]
MSEIDFGRVRTAAIAEQFATSGAALIEGLLPRDTCEVIAGMFEDEQRFRSTVTMERHGFGRGRYRYFGYPLPEVVAALREKVYPELVPIANAWTSAINGSAPYPESLGEFLAICHEAGQGRPTPLLLKYGPGDYNCLHQDLYGERAFPLQMAVLLSDRRSFTGGEFVLTEQRPRRQSRAEVIPLEQGDAVIFAVNERPVRGSRGTYRVRHRHGVSTLRSGTRLTLGIIFHDAA